MPDYKQPPKQTGYPTNQKATKYPSDGGSKAYGPKASGPLAADPGKEGEKYGNQTMPRKGPVGEPSA